MVDYGSANLESTVSKMVQTGTVVDRRQTNTGGQVKVFHKDTGVTSDWLPVGQSGSKGHVFYMPPPQINDQVTVLYHPSGVERGIVVCTNNTPLNQCFAPRTIDAIAIQGLDGSYFEYDPGEGCLSINGIATVYINAQGQIQITTGGDLDANVTGNLNATVGGNVEVSCTNLDATASGETTINAPTITLNANNVIVTGVLKTDFIKPYQASTVIATPQVHNSDGSGGGS